MEPAPPTSHEANPYLGPYRVLGPLGKGGMGEVVRAEDPRLHRQVAIKRIRVDTRGLDAAKVEARRTRFRREARILARLRHPAIVQVFELLSVEGEDHLVMELIDGPSLRQFLDQQGPLPAAETVELARTLAEGLAHAHRHGIVHRDLKTENVLLDPEGMPRLVDFGIARSDAPHLESEEALTAEGALLGTFRAMAPEQVSGEIVDARSDLFSLGVLITEVLTGTSPFEAGHQMATLARVLEAEPPDLDATSTPPALIDLVHQLMEKDPALRPRSAGEVANQLAALAVRAEETESTAEAPAAPRAKVEKGFPSAGRPGQPPGTGWKGGLRWAGIGMAAVLILWMMLTFRGEQPPEQLRISVLPTVVEGVPGSEGEILAFAVRSAALRTLGSLPGVVAPGTAEVDAVAAGRSPRQVALATAADQVLTSEMRCDATECWLELVRLDGQTGHVVWGDAVQASRAEPEVLSWAAGEAIAGGLPEHERDGAKTLPPALLAELSSLQLVEGQQRFGLDPEATYERLEELAKRFGAFAEIELWRARAALRIFARNRDQVWIDRAFAAVDTAAELSPDDPRVPFARLDAELTAGDLEAAGATLELLERTAPGDARVDELRSRWWLAKGEPDRALEELRRVVARRPTWPRLFNLARMAAQSGQIDLAFESLEALEQRSPGNDFGRRLRATLELKFGDLDRAAVLFAQMADVAPDLQAWSNLGVTHLLRRDPEAALAALDRALELEPGNVLVLLNLADAHSLAGDEERAALLYSRVLEGLGEAADSDPLSLTTRAQARARLGQATEAVADIETALRLSPENPSVRFEAALVYALVGDLTSAERNRRRALELGLEERWFSLAPFDVLL